jgi:hypothetical protein
MKTIGKNSDLFKLFDFEKHKNNIFNVNKPLRGLNETGLTSNELGQFSEYLSFEDICCSFKFQS